MNIREIEERLGIPRANVRYYEKEGLLHPARGSNNYRVYTEEDAAALEKIQLLRRLDMPIETIRAVQNGEVPLTEALERQSRLLAGDAARLAQAQAVCRALLEEGVTYAALEPARYREGALLPGGTEPPPRRPPVEGAQWAFHPWQRFWARHLDWALAGVPVTTVLALIGFGAWQVPSLVYQIVTIACTWLVVLAVEPLLLHTWGTTPGKWLLGLELRTEMGGKLSVRQGVHRVWEVLWVGYGFEIPIYSLYRQYKCYRACDEGEELSYDGEPGYLYYTTVPAWGLRAFASVAVTAALIPLTVWLNCQAILPPNRGAVTPAEFYENVNAMADKLGYSLWLDEEGWELSRETVNISTDDGRWEKREYGKRFGDGPVYTLETDADGFVTAVLCESQGAFTQEESGLPEALPVAHAQVAAAALAGTRVSGWRLLTGWLSEAVWTEGSDAWTEEGFCQDGLALTIDVQQEGYQLAGGSWLWPRDDCESGWYRCTIRLEYTE